jgi:hypothetical protein
MQDHVFNTQQNILLQIKMFISIVHEQQTKNIKLCNYILNKNDNWQHGGMNVVVQTCVDFACIFYKDKKICDET